MYDIENHCSHTSNPIVQVIYKQQIFVWINVHDLLYFLPSDDPTEVKFIWASEDTGYRHLYLITSQLSSYVNGVEEVPEPMDFVHLQPRVIQRIALTSGDWEVLGHNIWVDREKELVYFIGLRETPLEKHLYVVSLRRPGEIRLLTNIGYSYSVDFNEVITTVYRTFILTTDLKLLFFVGMHNIRRCIQQHQKSSCLSGFQNNPF